MESYRPEFSVVGTELNQVYIDHDADPGKLSERVNAKLKEIHDARGTLAGIRYSSHYVQLGKMNHTVVMFYSMPSAQAQ
jgi:hypothetical protein